MVFASGSSVRASGDGVEGTRGSLLGVSCILYRRWHPDAVSLTYVLSAVIPRHIRVVRREVQNEEMGFPCKASGGLDVISPFPPSRHSTPLTMFIDHGTWGR